MFLNDPPINVTSVWNVIDIKNDYKLACCNSVLTIRQTMVYKPIFYSFIFSNSNLPTKNIYEV